VVVTVVNTVVAEGMPTITVTTFGCTGLVIDGDGVPVDVYGGLLAGMVVV
jgi:hypothetical protein